MRLFLSTLVLAFLTASPVFAQSTCQVAEILFGPIKLDKVIYPDGGYETAIVRSDTFDNPDKPYGAILGEITVDRGGFAVRTPAQTVVGVIGPDLKVEGWDEVCGGSSEVVIAPINKGNYATLIDNKPVGTVSGFFPANDFGVPSE
ncbi:hypothetical protein NX862_11180 [Rhodobacter sp. KR11]|uniref:hypothetical protein n=1 Tax=Rhodobacter sp. KR11 TaxID=2974588 RepID=UPI002221E102|nr:hypothetical protein [Rhodobacter sp. KR11]MCW1919321.1 hypothetical protein [Rhodobacter sp. KR11]